MIIQYSCQNQNLTKRSIWNSPVCLNNYTRAMLKWESLKINGKRNRGKLIHVGHRRMASVPPQKLPIACCRAPAIWCAHLICSPIVNNLQKHGCTGLLEKKNIDIWWNPVGENEAHEFSFGEMTKPLQSLHDQNKWTLCWTGGQKNSLWDSTISSDVFLCCLLH